MILLVPVLLAAIVIAMALALHLACKALGIDLGPVNRDDW